MTAPISPHQCLEVIDQIFVDICREEGVLSRSALSRARRIQKRYVKQGEHASIQDILLYEGLLSRDQVDQVCRKFSDQIWGCTGCNAIKRFGGGLLPERCPSCSASLVRVFRVPTPDQSTVATNEDGTYRFKRGARIGRYTIRDTIGSGSMGLVFRAKDEHDRPVALKVLHPDGGLTWEDVKRFQHEIQSMQDLAHEHIMGVTDSGQADGFYYYSMELVEGKSLGDRIAHREITLPDALRIGAQLARALAHIHARGVVHRDLKPDNILFDERDSPRIVDFGIAKNALQTTQVTEYGTALGTPAYMSPEQARGEIQRVGPATDIYSLGVLLYEMSTGQTPFEEEHNVSRLLDRIERDEPPPPRQVNPACPEALEAVILRAMAKQPEQRYRDAALLASDLESVARGEAPAHVGAPPAEGLWSRLVKRWSGGS